MHNWQDLEKMVNKLMKKLTKEMKPILKEIEKQIPMSSELIEKYNQIVRRTFKITYNVRNQRQFDLLRALALLSDIKIEDETKNTFDEIFSYYYPEVECLQNYKTMVYETVFDDLLWDPYEILYYFMIMPITRYVNNYGTYKNIVFENNMERQMKKIQRVFTHYSINMVRKEFGAINNLIKEYNVNVYDMELNEILTYHVEYRWRSKSGACKYCESLENRPLQKINYSKIHYNCRCNVVKIEWYENSKGQKLKYSQKIIT